MREPEVRALFLVDDDDEQRLISLGEAFRAQLDEAERVLDGVAGSARTEAAQFAGDPEPLLALVDQVRQLSRR